MFGGHLFENLIGVDLLETQEQLIKHCQNYIY